MEKEVFEEEKGDQSVCRKRRVADGELRQRRRQAFLVGELLGFGVEDNVTEDQHSPGQTAIPSDPECALERAAEDGETRRLRKRLLSPEEGEEGEEEDEEPALHSCDSCRQVFESLSDLTEHKINQCQLTGKQRSAHRASPQLCHSALLPLPLSLYAFIREYATLCVSTLCQGEHDYQFPW
ncbi:hypothetical protein PAMP_004936 [Pampus punctatissimus]